MNHKIKSERELKEGKNKIEVLSQKKKIAFSRETLGWREGESLTYLTLRNAPKRK